MIGGGCLWSCVHDGYGGVTVESRLIKEEREIFHLLDGEEEDTGEREERECKNMRETKRKIKKKKNKERIFK